MKTRVACTNCRLRKKRCDKGYPICSYCLSTHSQCLYERQDDKSSPESTSSIPTVSVDLLSSNVKGSALTTAFLDCNLWDKIRHNVSLNDVSLPSDLLHYSEEISVHDLLAMQTVTLDVWLPFLSPHDLSIRWSQLSKRSPGRDLLLLLCLDMFSHRPDAEDPRTEAYLKIKSVLVGAEIDGTFSMQVLQAIVLVLFYEYAHGIYPAAYFTLSTCTRLMGLMGFEELLNEEFGEDWYEIEAQRRIWWAVFTLERCMTAGCPQRAMCLREPNVNTPLPCDDAPWKHHDRPLQHTLTLSSQVVCSMGKFRLLAHSSFLLSRAIGYVAKANIQDAVQLERTILALLKLLEITDEDGIVSVGGSRAILYSALFLLLAKSPQTIDMLQTERHHPADYFLTRSRMFLDGNLGSVNIATPFLLTWGYETCKHFLIKSHIDGRPESMEAVKLVGQILNVLNQRWRLSGVYNSLLRINQAFQP